MEKTEVGVTVPVTSVRYTVDTIEDGEEGFRLEIPLPPSTPSQGTLPSLGTVDTESSPTVTLESLTE